MGYENQNFDNLNTKVFKKECEVYNTSNFEGEKNIIENETKDETIKLKCDFLRFMNDDLSLSQKIEYKEIYDNLKEKLDKLSHFQKQIFQKILGIKPDGTFGENSKKAFFMSNLFKVKNGEIIIPNLPTRKEANDIWRETIKVSKDDMIIFQKHIGIIGEKNIDGIFGRNTLINYISKYPNWKNENIKSIIEKVKKDIKTIENTENKFNEFLEKSNKLSVYQGQIFQEILGVEPDGILGKQTYNNFINSPLFNIQNGEIVLPKLPTREQAQAIQKQVEKMSKSDIKLVQGFIGANPDGFFGRKSFISYIKSIPNWSDLNSLQNTLETITKEPENQIERNKFNVENFYKNVDRVSSGFLQRYLERLTGKQIAQLNLGKQRQFSNVLNEKLNEVYVPIQDLKNFVIAEVFDSYSDRTKYGELLKTFLHRLYRMGIEPEIFFTKIFIHESRGNQNGARQFAASGTGSLGLGQTTTHAYLNEKQNNIFNPLNDRQAVSGAIKHFIMEAYRYVHKSKMPVEYLIAYCLDIYNKGLTGSKKIVDSKNIGVKNEYDRNLAYMLNPNEKGKDKYQNPYNYSIKVLNGTNKYVPWNKSNPYYK